MRRTYAFLLNILFDEDDSQGLRGRVRPIARDQELTFASAEELLRLLRAEIRPDESERPSPANPGETQA